jgi:hypothetical protein
MILGILSEKVAFNCKHKLQFLNRIEIKFYAEYTTFSVLHILYSWTLSIVLSLSKMLTKYNVSEIEFYLRPQVKPTQLGPIDRASPYFPIPISL